MGDVGKAPGRGAALVRLASARRCMEPELVTRSFGRHSGSVREPGAGSRQGAPDPTDRLGIPRLGAGRWRDRYRVGPWDHRPVTDQGLGRAAWRTRASEHRDRAEPRGARLHRARNRTVLLEGGPELVGAGRFRTTSRASDDAAAPFAKPSMEFASPSDADQPVHFELNGRIEVGVHGEVRMKIE